MQALIDLARKIKYWADAKFGVFSRFMQFCFVGASGMAIDLTTYYVLLKLSVYLPVAGAISIFISLSCNFLFNRRLTFNYARHENIFNQYLRFAAACSLGIVLSWTIRVLLPNYPFFEDHKMLSAMVGILAGTFSNFLTSFLWVFNHKKED